MEVNGKLSLGTEDLVFQVYTGKFPQNLANLTGSSSLILHFFVDNDPNRTTIQSRRNLALCWEVFPSIHDQ